MAGVILLVAVTAAAAFNEGLVLRRERSVPVCDTAKSGPRRVLNLPRAKDNPRNGEGDFLRLKDGRILFVYTEYRGESNLDHAPAHLVKCTSSDGGETWTKPVELVPRSGKQNDMCVSLIRLKDGRIGLMYLRKNSSTDCMPVMRFSSDEGEAWSGETECVTASNTAYWVGNNARLTMLKSGRLIEPLARHNPSDGQYGRLMCVYSDDQGATWKNGTLYEPPKDEEGKPVIMQEPGVVELKDGRLYLYARTDRGRQWQAFSKDGGVTWEDFGPSPIYGPRGPATIKRLKSGDLLLVWNDHEGHPEWMKRGEPWLVGIRAPLTLAISKDEGRTWINRRTLETDLDGFFCYFAVLEQDDGLLLAYYNQPNLAGCCVTKVPFDWLQASFGASAKVELAAVFGDRMVLQRERPVPVWGTAAPGEAVKVSFADQSVSCVADASGRWRVDLKPMKASKEGRDLVVSSANQAIEQSNNRTIFHDVLVGEVWFASGQSNMELPIWGVSPHRRDEYGAQTVQTLRNPYVRYAKTANYKWSEAPKADFAEPVAWKDFTKENLLNQTDEWGRGTFSAVGVYYALELYHALDVPIGVIGAYWGGTRIEPWIPQEGFGSITNGAALAARKRPDAKQNASVLWNEQVAPWAPFALRGVIWYQGCANVGDSGDYCGLMHALYDGWSKAFGRDDLKLYFVQLAPYRYDGELSDDFPLLQEAQARFAAEEPNAGMVVTSDVGNPEDCHPNRKLIVAKRLALLALKRDYGYGDIVADSPTLRSWEAGDGKFVLSFDHVTRWSMYAPDFSVDSGFEVAGTNGVWRPAELVNLAVREKGRYKSKGFVSGRDLVVAAKDVPQPVRLRYLYREPWYGALQNEVGLPLGPFYVEKKGEE